MAAIRAQLHAQQANTAYYTMLPSSIRPHALKEQSIVYQYKSIKKQTTAIVNVVISGVLVFFGAYFMFQYVSSKPEVRVLGALVSMMVVVVSESVLMVRDFRVSREMDMRRDKAAAGF